MNCKSPMTIKLALKKVVFCSAYRPVQEFPDPETGDGAALYLQGKMVLEQAVNLGGSLIKTGQYPERARKVPGKYQKSRQKVQGKKLKKCQENIRKVLGKYQEFTVKVLGKYCKSTGKLLRKQWESSWKELGKYLKCT